MVLTERELLVKIEQQLKSLSESHKEVLSEISLLFNKQDKDSRLLAVLNTEFKHSFEVNRTFKEESTHRCSLNREELTKRIVKNEGHIEKIFTLLDTVRVTMADNRALTNNSINSNRAWAENVDNEIRAELESAKVSILNELNNKVGNEANNRVLFETTIKSYVKSSKIFVSIVAFLITILTSSLYPIISAFLSHWVGSGK